MDIAQQLAATQALIDERITSFLPEPVGPAARLLAAMRHSVQGGKRVRAFITIRAAEMFGLATVTVLPAAIAIEFMHAASLIHDDMPCIDDSPMRRGLPSSHTQFDEHTALLAGDALIVRAFELLALLRTSGLDAEAVLRVVGEFAEATGAMGLIGGEAADIEAENEEAEAGLLNFIHTNKTAKLIVAAARSGAILGGAEDTALRTLTEYAHHLGLLFQIADDILDATASEAQLGKPVGADEASQKMTYPALLGVEGSRQRAQEVAAMAIAAAEALPAYNELWIELVNLLLQRDN